MVFVKQHLLSAKHNLQLSERFIFSHVIMLLQAGYKQNKTVYT